MKMWTLWCAMCVLLLSVLSVQSGLGLNSSNKCNTAFGLEGGIEDGQLSALSYYESFSNGNGEVFQSHPRCARKDHHYCAWCAESADGQYLEVDLRSDVLITGIATQGFETLSGAYFVTKYKVAFSRDRKTWKCLPVMTGNHDGRSVVRHNFSSPMCARYIRVYPMAYRNKICLRMELYGCSNPPSALTTTPAPTTQSAANDTSENLPPVNRATASTSTENPMINNSTTAPSSLRTKLSSTTLHVVSITTTATEASSTEKPMTSHSATDQPFGSVKTIILIVVAIAAVQTICLLLWFCHRKRKRNELRKSKEGVEELSAVPRQQPHGSSPEITEITEGYWIEDESDLEVPTNEIVMSNANP